MKRIERSPIQKKTSLTPQFPTITGWHGRFNTATNVACACLSLASLALSTGAARAEECPADTSVSARYCCKLADPLDGFSAQDGGYGWHGTDSSSDGLCQGFASTNVSGPVLEVLSLRENTSLSPLPDEIELSFRTIAPISEARFMGRPLGAGNTFLVAGAVEVDAKTLWQTGIFDDTDQKLSRFGFAAKAVVQGAEVFTPLLMTAAGSSMPPRSQATLVLRSNRSLLAAKVILEEIDISNLTVKGAPAREMKHDLRRARRLTVMLPDDLPEAFRINVAICAHGTPACALDVAHYTFDILWGSQ